MPGFIASPPGLPLLGHVRAVRRDPLAFFTTCARTYGDVVRLRLGPFPALLVSDPTLIEAILARHHQQFDKGRGLRSNRRLLGNGLLLSEGDYWLRQRKMVQPAFHRERLTQYAETMVDSTERLTSSWHEGEVLDIHEAMMRLTLVIVGKVLFGADVANKADIVARVTRTGLQAFDHRAQTLFLLPERLPTPANVRFFFAAREMDSLVYGLIRERRQSAARHGDLLDELLAAQDDEGTGGMSDKQLRDEVMTLLLAGHETTALALTWAFWLLAQHADIEQRLAAEVRDVLGSRSPGIADLPALRLTEAVVNESLRLYPPAWTLIRRSLEPVALDGLTIPTRNAVFMSQWVMHRDPRFFEHPEAFDPDRWLGEAAARIPAGAFFPFGIGPRQCVGRRFAMMEAVLLLAGIVQRFSLTRASNEAIGLRPSVTLRPDRPVMMTVHRRS
ncbi:MAG: cytochrome P450 [Chloroflexi bacterium]|nr:cytochrome P450 [Chloroflexota bacterium]